MPRLPHDARPAGRPASVEPAPEPTRLPGETHPPTYNLRVWSETAGWETLAWVTSGRGTASAAASLLRVGIGGPYARAETWGPRHPDSWRHDWTQEGQQLMDRHPRESYAEDAVRYAEKRRREEAALAARLAARSAGTLTVETAAARLASGGREYRDFLRVGQICVMDALDEHRLSFPEGGNERVLARQALDLLEERHEVEDWVVTLTRAHMATTRRDAPYSEGAQRWRERAFQEYLSPRKEVVDVPGLFS
ncbi:hypothetical protein ACH4OX_05860 [Streptomyces roseolus]|uniref:hypothetical protein n=1 Tax=Streptomyces roseolus TaxID=67358 RepID=UPI00378EBB70